MTHSTLWMPIFAVAVIGMLVTGIGCDSATVGPDVPMEAQLETPEGADAAVLSKGNSETQKGLATLRGASAGYHRVEAALEDGFIQAGACADPPGSGALGIPYVNLGRLDATINLDEPEVLFYEPQENGRLRLVGVETVVPIAEWDAIHDEPPSLFGQEFHENVAEGLYGLHMWVWRHNPEGMFAFANPNVSCEFAE